MMHHHRSKPSQSWGPPPPVSFGLTVNPPTHMSHSDLSEMGMVFICAAHIVFGCLKCKIVLKWNCQSFSTLQSTKQKIMLLTDTTQHNLRELRGTHIYFTVSKKLDSKKRPVFNPHFISKVFYNMVVTCCTLFTFTCEQCLHCLLVRL